MTIKFGGSGLINFGSNIVFSEGQRLNLPNISGKLRNTVYLSLSSDGSTNFIFILESSGRLRLGVPGNGNLDFSKVFPSGSSQSMTGAYLERSGTTTTLTVGGESFSVETGTGDLTYDRMSGLGSNYKINAEVSGVMELIDSNGVTLNSWDFSDNSNPSQLTDSVGGNHGSLVGFTSGNGYIEDTTPTDPNDDSLTVDGISDNMVQYQDRGYFGTLKVSGGFVDIGSDSIQYKLNGGASLDFYKLSIDSSNDTFTGEILLPNGTHDIAIHLASDTTVVQNFTNVRIVYSILVWGQSNAGGSNQANQSLTLDPGAPTPLMVRWDDAEIVPLADPTAKTGGTFVPALASLYANAGMLVCITNVAVGGTRLERWLKSANDLYPQTEVQANLTGGGYNIAISVIGEGDHSNNTSSTVITAQMSQITTDLKMDYGCDNYITYVPKSNASSYHRINEALGEAINTNLFAFFGGNLNVIDVTDGPQADDTHLITTEEFREAAEIIYASTVRTFEGRGTTRVIMSLSGVPDGDHLTRIVDVETNYVCFSGLATWVNGTCTKTIQASDGVDLEYYVINESEGVGGLSTGSGS